MSMETVTCPACGTQIPANARFCSECGHANTSAAALAPKAVPPQATSQGAQPGTGFSTPMPPPAFYAGSESAPVDSSMQTQAGTPTVNIGMTGEQPEQPRYVPAQPADAWQPGQYSTDADANPTWQTPAPSYAAQPPAQAPYSSPPGQQYGPTQSFPPYGTQPQETGQPGQVPAYSQYAQPPFGYQYQSQIGVAGTPRRDPTVALLLELLGYVGFLGIGHIYAGRTGRGVALLVGGFIYLMLSGILVFLLVGCLMLLVWLAVPILSGLWVRSDLERENGRAGQPY